MKRREFLARLLGSAVGAAVAATVDVDHLLWEPGAKTIFVPPVDGWVANDAGIFLRRGDMFTIAGRYALNPLTRRPTEHLQQFVVTRDVSADEKTINIAGVYPHLNPTLDTLPPHGRFETKHIHPLGSWPDGRRSPSAHGRTPSPRSRARQTRRL